MNRIVQASLRCAILATLWLATAAAAQQDMSAVSIQTVAVRGNLHMLVGSGGNIGVLHGADGVIVIDDQFAPLTAKIVAAIRELDKGPLRFVINTHWHGDHVGGNANLAREGALIVAHDNVRTRMKAGQFNSFLQRQTEPAETAALPVISFSDSMQLFLNAEDMHIIHVPKGHTDGDSVIHFPGLNAFRLGDIYFAGTYPFIDGESGGSVDGVLAAIDRVLPMMDANSLVIPGHGLLSSRAELLAYREMLASVSAKVREGIASGMKREELVSSRPSSAFDERFGKGFVTPERFAGMLFDLLSAPATAR